MKWCLLTFKLDAHTDDQCMSVENVADAITRCLIRICQSITMNEHDDQHMISAPTVSVGKCCSIVLQTVTLVSYFVLWFSHNRASVCMQNRKTLLKVVTTQAIAFIQ